MTAIPSSSWKSQFLNSYRGRERVFKSRKILRFKGKVYLRQCAALISQEEFEGVFLCVNNFLILENSDLIVPMDNIAFMRGSFETSYE